METERFKTLKMAAWAAHHRGPMTRSMHSSNPQPLDWTELEGLCGFNPNQFTHPLGYANERGSEALRRALASALYPGLDEGHIITTCGAQEALFIACQAMLQPGDETLCLTPAFEPLLAFPAQIGCRVHTSALHAQDDWQPDLDEIEQRLRRGVQLMLLNWPHNPTGQSVPHETFTQILNMCQAHGCRVLSDEVFRGLEHRPKDRLPAVAVALPGAVSLGVASKALALPGVRLGWIACRDKDLLERMLQIKSHLSICTSTLDDALMQRVVPHCERVFERNRKLMIANKAHMLQNWPRSGVLSISQTRGGCVCFPLLNAALPASDFATVLHHETGLMVYPGEVFSTAANGFRLGFGDRDFAGKWRALNQVLQGHADAFR